MDQKRRRGVLALFLILSIGGYFRIEGHDTVRPVLFLTILVMGIFAGILLSDLTHILRTKKSDKDKLV